jgi:hypothetical protein
VDFNTRDQLLIRYSAFCQKLEIKWEYNVRVPHVTGEKNSPTEVHACHKRQLKWILGAWGYNWATQSPGDINMETWSSRLGVGAQG